MVDLPSDPIVGFPGGLHAGTAAGLNQRYIVLLDRDCDLTSNSFCRPPEGTAKSIPDWQDAFPTSYSSDWVGHHYPTLQVPPLSTSAHLNHRLAHMTTSKFVRKLISFYATI